MPYSTTSIEPVTLGDSSYQMTFSNMELQRDMHAVIVKCNITNTGQHKESISSQYFIIAADGSEAAPKVSYISEPNKQGMLWTWKQLKPGETCTIILRYQLESTTGSYRFNYLVRQRAKLIQTFHFS
jgi:hypothetical protein